MTTEANALPASLNLRLYKGDDFSRALQFVDSDDDAIDITGWTFLAQVRDVPGGETVRATFTATISDGANGRLTLSLSGDDIDDLDTGKRLAWDLQATDDDSKVRTYLRGSVMVDSDTSRSA